jgi:hypothetical protein
MPQASCLSVADTENRAAPAPSTSFQMAERKELWYPLACAIVLVLPFALGLFELGRPCFWYDEAATWDNVRGNWRHLWDHARQGEDCGGCAYAVLVKVTSSLMGRSEFALRLPSVLCGLAFVAMMLIIGHCVWGPRAALCIGLLAALHPEVVCWSRQARAYSLEMFAAALCLASLLIDGRLSPRTRRIALGAAACLLVLTHAFGLFFVVGIAVLLVHARLLRLTSRGQALQACLSPWPVGSALALNAAWMFFMKSRIRYNLSDFWIKGSVAENYLSVFQTLLPIPLLYAVLVLTGIVLLLRDRSQTRNRTVVWVIVILAVPVLGGPLGPSMVSAGSHNFVLARYFLPLIPLCVLPLGYLFSRLPRWFGTAAALGFGLATLAISDTGRLYDHFAYDGCENRQAYGFLTERLHKDDRVIAYPGYQRVTLEYYRVPSSAILTVPDGPALQKLLRAPPGHSPGGRTWLAFYSRDMNEDLQGYPQWVFGNLRVIQID